MFAQNILKKMVAMLKNYSQIIITNLNYCPLIWHFQKLISGKLAVTNQSFMQLLATIDECLTFLHNHPHYKDSSVYITKYEQCLSK